MVGKNRQTRKYLTNTQPRNETMSNTPQKQPHEVLIPVIDETKPAELYQGSTLKLKIDAMEEEVNALYLDPSNPVDYKHFGSFGLLIAKVGTAVERTGKDVAKDLRKDLKVYDDLRISSVKRIAALKAKFMLPRVQFDEEVAAYNKAINDLAELFQHGHIKLAEFRKPTEAEWTAHIVLCESAVISEELQGDRLEEFQKLKAEAVEMNQRRFAEFIETEKALEAGRIALKEKDDAEAAERHSEREKAKLEQEKSNEADPKNLPGYSKTEPEAKETPKPAVTPESTAKNAVYGQLLKRGMDKDKAILFVNAIAAGQVEYLKLEV